MSARDDADRMALAFLADCGPHTMGTIEDEDGLAAMMIFLDLERAGLVHRTDFGGGRLQFSLTEAGRAKAEGAA